MSYCTQRQIEELVLAIYNIFPPTKHPGDRTIIKLEEIKDVYTAYTRRLHSLNNLACRLIALICRDAAVQMFLIWASNLRWSSRVTLNTLMLSASKMRFSWTETEKDISRFPSRTILRNLWGLASIWLLINWLCLCHILYCFEGYITMGSTIQMVIISIISNFTIHFT